MSWSLLALKHCFYLQLVNLTVLMLKALFLLITRQVCTNYLSLRRKDRILNY